jgi:Protein of unknown function (DUF2589)
VAITSVEALQLSQVLGSLLASVVDAQAQSARATVDFIEGIGFEETGEGSRLRQVKVRYSKKDENGQVAEFEVEVPLLALVNVPSLAVKQAKLTFAYDVVTASATQARAAPAGTAASRPALPVVKLTGFIRPPSRPVAVSEKHTSSIDLEVTLEQQELPIGIERLFDLAELGITERPTPSPP